MKINRIILKGVNNFENLDLTFKDEWTGIIPDSLLLMGINGSGKTTILRAISNFWWMLGELLSSHGEDIEASASSQLAHYGFVALELYEFLPEYGKSIWLCLGNEYDVKQLATKNEGSLFIAAISKSESESEKIKKYSLLYITSSAIKISISDISESLTVRYISNVLGGKLDLPNMILIPSEGRTINPIGEEPIEPEQIKFQWLAHYRAVTKRKNSVQSYLFTLKAFDEDKYKLIIENVNQFLTGKKISGFDHNGELLVTVDNGESHPIYLLSSGEKQVLLIIAYITRKMQPGGIVLIDEPGLHLHTSLSTAFVSFISRMVSKQQGQLILASHDTDVWQYFPVSQRVNLNEV